jgi:hypothetical protein
MKRDPAAIYPSGQTAAHSTCGKLWSGTGAVGHDLRDVVIAEPKMLSDERAGNRASGSFITHTQLTFNAESQRLG